MENKYLGKNAIFNIDKYNDHRKVNISYKAGAMFIAFLELNGIINTAAMARQYFKRSPGWLSQRINGNTVFEKKAMFKESEYHQLANAFRDIAKRLNAHADEIDAAASDYTIPDK